MLAHRVQGRDRIEALDEDHRRSRPQGDSQHGVEPVDVEQGHHRQPDVVGMHGQARVGLHLFEVGEEVAVGETGRLRCAGGAGGEHEHGVVALAPVDDRRGVGGEQLVEHGCPLEAHPPGHEHVLDSDGSAVDAGEGVAGAGPHDRHTGAGGRHLPLELGRWGHGVQGDAHRPRPQNGQVGDDEEPVVGRHQRHPVAGLEAANHQPASQGGHLGAQLAVGRLPAPAEQGHGVVGMGLDDGRQVHVVTLLTR